MSLTLPVLVSLAAAGHARRADFVTWDLAAHGVTATLAEVTAEMEALAKRGLVHADGKGAWRVFRMDGEVVREALRTGFEKKLKAKKKGVRAT